MAVQHTASNIAQAFPRATNDKGDLVGAPPIRLVRLHPFEIRDDDPARVGKNIGHD